MARETEWGKAYLANRKRVCAHILKMSDEDLRKLVPPPKSLIVYGLGMNLDPVRGKRMTWGGWKNPFKVRDTKGNLYPNDEWPDTGDGVVDKKTGARYYFVAQVNGHIIEQLEQKMLPALADVYALTGSKEHAHKAGGDLRRAGRALPHQPPRPAGLPHR